MPLKGKPHPAGPIHGQLRAHLYCWPSSPDKPTALEDWDSAENRGHPLQLRDLRQAVETSVGWLLWALTASVAAFAGLGAFASAAVGLAFVELASNSERHEL